MRVCLDTNVLVQLFGTARSYRPITDALQHGRLELAISNEILFEYEETLTQLSGRARWQMVMAFFNAVSQLHNNILYLAPQYRFRVITADPDDNKFVDCAIAAAADFVLTSDRHFDALLSSGYKPRPIEPGQFIGDHL